jgi:hypothetical protein
MRLKISKIFIIPKLKIEYKDVQIVNLFTQI